MVIPVELLEEVLVAVTGSVEEDAVDFRCDVDVVLLADLTTFESGLIDFQSDTSGFWGRKEELAFVMFQFVKNEFATRFRESWR